MWSIVALACAGCLVYMHIRRKAEVVGKMNAGDMLGFHWGDSIETVAKWARKVGLKYLRADNATASVSFIGKFPGALPKASYNFFMPNGKLDSIAVLIMDATAYTFGVLLDKFAQKYGECWDAEEDNATWIEGKILIVLFQGKSGYLHIRYLNLRNLGNDKTIEDEHDGVIQGLRAFDEELARHIAEQSASKKG